MTTPSIKGKHEIPKWVTWALSTAVAVLTIFLLVFSFGRSVGGHQAEFIEQKKEISEFKKAFDKHCADNKVLFDGIVSAATAQREYQHKMELFMTAIDGRLTAIEAK